MRCKRIITLCLLISHTLVGKLPDALEALITNADSGVHVGVDVYSLKDQKTVYQKNADKRFTPASTIKLFTAAAALWYLGENFTFKTYVYGLGSTMHIKGSGDPSLSAHDLTLLLTQAHEKSNQPLKTLNIDDSVFDPQKLGPEWAWNDVGNDWCPELSGFLIDGKIPPRDTFSSVETVEYKPCPKNAPLLAEHTSPPLRELIATMLKESDNLIAECFFKKLAAEKRGEPGSWENGAEIINNFLCDVVGLAPESFYILDGSGLSRHNLVMPHHVTTLLLWAFKNKTSMQPLIDGLAVSGLDGTLRNRALPGDLVVKGKTGAMAHTSALSGYIMSANDSEESLIFSILSNGFMIPTKKYKHYVEDTLCCALYTEYSKTLLGPQQIANLKAHIGTKE